MLMATLTQVVVSLDQCDCPVFVPNAFTPNDDDRNEGFRPHFDCPFDVYVFQVFDRWGELIWESTDALQSWDGGGYLPDGTKSEVYAWRLELRPITVYEHATRKLTGHVVLLR